MIAAQQGEEIAALREQVDTIRASVTDYENALNARVLRLLSDEEDADAPWSLFPSAGRARPPRLRLPTDRRVARTHLGYRDALKPVNLTSAAQCSVPAAMDFAKASPLSFGRS